GISSAHHLSGVAIMPHSIMEMKPSPLVELYIDELKAVNTADETRINVDVYKVQSLSMLFSRKNPRRTYG
ncbi:MAG: hypothetical protein J6R23_04780, partial [Spirochaetales bacterium]|nr:hypothetical protein [Spirochaetales bacterium]